MGAPKQKWTADEEAALKAGVIKHGAGKWRTILKDPEYSGVLYLRSNVDLKDKWRNMSVMAHGWSSREKSKLVTKRVHNVPKREDAVDNVKSDEEAVDIKALEAAAPLMQIPALKRSAIRKSVIVDDVVLICMLGLCARMGDLEMGTQFHGCMMKMGFTHSIKACNAMMNMYVKCGLLADARKIFRGMDEPNVVSWSILLEGVIKWEGVQKGMELFDAMPERNEVGWTIMIAGCVGSGFIKKGCKLLNEMFLWSGLRLNHVSLCSILSASAQSGGVAIGRWVHVFALKEGELNFMVGTALVDMYAKCGRINMAIRVFENLPRKNVVTWNAMLGGLAMHGKGKAVLQMFTKMLEEAKPDDLTFIAVLSACSHAGLVDQGRKYFLNLQSEYGIIPKIDHYACMVDLLGRAGHVEEAGVLIENMPMPPNEVVLGSLLGSCNIYGKLQLGEMILQRLVEMDPQNTEYHILLSNIYALSGKQKQANSMRDALTGRGIRKMPGISSIHVGGHVHQFTAGDRSHPQTPQIYHTLDDMVIMLRLAGYAPHTSSQIFAGSDGNNNIEEKEQALLFHSEKLALCFGLISTLFITTPFTNQTEKICFLCPRLDNLIIEAITTLKEPDGSNKTAIASYIEEQYWPPQDFKRILSAKLKHLTSAGKLIKVKRKYRIAPTSFTNRKRSASMLLLDGRQRVFQRAEREEFNMPTKAQLDVELSKMRTMSAQEAEAVAARAVAEAENAIAEAEEAAREAEAAEADAEAAQAFAEAAMKTIKGRNNAKTMRV
ncbi:Pentatricopeptide repeat-containing protein At5g15340, mitochondrial [Linum perenne]